jgi:hypothetical protein
LFSGLKPVDHDKRDSEDEEKDSQNRPIHFSSFSNDFPVDFNPDDDLDEEYENT